MSDIYNNIVNEMKSFKSFVAIKVGVVTNIDDPEKKGRVKVKLMNMDKDKYETEFIRVMTPMAGSDWGMFFIPEVGDLVLLAFPEGEMSTPYVLGSLWTDNKKPPESIKESKNNIRMIKTKSGHTIVFNDEKDQESIEIKTSKDISLKLEDKNTIITLSDKDKNNLIKIDGEKGEITIKSKSKINLESGKTTVSMDDKSFDLNCDGNIKLNAKGNVNISGQQTTLEGKTGTNVKSSGQTAVSGSIVKLG